ncbi:MAG TPA: zinc ribbon domain-containing protein [Deltaproteobacteria bacterium]|nr:zinc ribbon domain-containing protein [Deltaproteobacteria bacterium]
MPIYEYKCKNCDHEFEMIVFSGSDDKDIECPECGKKKAEKMISKTARSGGGCADSCSATSCFT